jgi:signal peptidase I
MARKNNKAENVVEKKPKETPVEFLASLAAVLATGLFIITFVVQAFAIPSSSMENTLLIGDHVLVNRIQLAPKSSLLGPLLPYSEIRRGDIVVFLSPQTPGLYVVKRIIGIPGDRIHLRDVWSIAMERNLTNRMCFMTETTSVTITETISR